MLKVIRLNDAMALTFCRLRYARVQEPVVDNTVDFATKNPK